MRRPAGFTLVEVVVALTLAAVALLAAHRLVVALHRGVEGLEQGRAALDREANARLLLAKIVAGIVVDADGAAFRGEPNRATFTTWQSDAHGYAVRRRAAIERQNGALVLKGVYSEPASLFEGVEKLDVDYLLEPGASERFVRVWNSEAGPPAALRLRLGSVGRADTLLLVVGRRG